MITSPGNTISQQQFTDATTDETLGDWVIVAGRAYVTFFVSGVGVTSGGVITIEEAAPKDFAVGINAPIFGAATGNYSSVTTVNASDVDGGKQKAVHLTTQGYYAVRARISTAISGGGSISVGVVAY